MQLSKLLSALTVLVVVAVSLTGAAPVPVGVEADVVAKRAIQTYPVRPGGLLAEPMPIPGLPQNPVMNNAARAAHEELNAAGVLSADGSRLLRWPMPHEEGLIRHAATYLRAMTQRYPETRINEWPDYIGAMFRAGRI